MTPLRTNGVRNLMITETRQTKNNIRETIETHASSNAFEKNTRVKDASQDIDRISENDAKELENSSYFEPQSFFSNSNIGYVIFTDLG